MTSQYAYGLHMKKIFVSLVVCAILFAFKSPVYAAGIPVAGASAQPSFTDIEPDHRVEQLKSYLASMRSPMVGSAEHFVTEADRLSLDWRLVAAIAGVESTFGQHIPRNSYNGWGWGVFTGTNDGKHFDSWNDGITQVSEGLRYNYIDKGAVTIDQMGRKYAASGTWSSKVKFFLTKIDTFSPKRASQLAVTI